MSQIDIKVPSIGESITEVTLAKIIKKEGDFVNLDEAICEFESDKATFELPAETAGTIRWKAKEGDDLKVGAVVAQINNEGKASEKKPVPQDSSKASETTSVPKSETVKNFPSPSASKMMREQNISPKEVKASGKDERITKSDVVQFIDEKKQAPVEPATDSKAISIIDPSARIERREKMSRMRRTIAKRLVSSKNESAMLTTFNEVDMFALMELRNKYNEKYQEKYGIKIGFMSIFAKACAQVLLRMPEVNAFIDGEEFIYHEYTDISIAISTPNGLVVPPIRNVESLKLHEFEFKLKELAEKARANKLSLEEMTGGTFTITNGGVFGSLMSTPIINEPQSAILGMHAIKDRPIALNGQVTIRPMMYLALSYDHRVIDGSSSVTFLVRVKELIEDPVRIFLEI
ncbi:MAG: 2-oxoglutarate dehydrogenase complex dihydrolipoyllysine-residue succinyltransferase [Bacteroidota bacterium]|nr:2-oxoglutarate dehydrogenase complex dihydrolipoyllysine-residue succinyltransferase [Bacteroidota bacterium]